MIKLLHPQKFLKLKVLTCQFLKNYLSLFGNSKLGKWVCRALWCSSIAQTSYSIVCQSSWRVERHCIFPAELHIIQSFVYLNSSVTIKPSKESSMCVCLFFSCLQLVLYANFLALLEALTWCSDVMQKVWSIWDCFCFSGRREIKYPEIQWKLSSYSSWFSF